jgi:hypothetical protein
VTETRIGCNQTFCEGKIKDVCRRDKIRLSPPLNTSIGTYTAITHRLKSGILSPIRWEQPLALSWQICSFRAFPNTGIYDIRIETTPYRSIVLNRTKKKSIPNLGMLFVAVAILAQSAYPIGFVTVAAGTVNA